MMHRKLLLIASLLGVLGVGGAAYVAAQGSARTPGTGLQTSEGVHIAVEGDTLYGLASRYFGDPAVWPRLWALNPHVTNPHWIYPGDVIFLSEDAQGQEPVARDRSRIEGSTARVQDEAAGLYFPLGGFYSSREYPVVGTIRYARTDRGLLHPLDEIYIELEEGTRVNIGDEFVINRVEGRVYERRELQGVRYRTTGRIRVTGFNPGLSVVTAQITALYDSIERGDVLFAAQPQLLVVRPTASTVDLEGTIIDRLDPLRHMGQYHYIFIDKGYNDGVRVGNRFFMWEREDGGLQVMLHGTRERYADHQENIPWQRIGEALVIYATEGYATAVVTRTEREVSVGHRVTLQRGF